MYKGLLLFVVLAILLSWPVVAQVRLLGKVTDAVTGQGLPFVSVRVPDTALGTTSNADGEFELILPAKGKQLIFSELGYVPDSVLVGEEKSLLVKLKPSPMLLPEVQVPNYVENLLTRAYRVLLRNNHVHSYGQAFYRQVTRLQKEATEVQEQLWNTETCNTGVKGTALMQGRYAKKKSLVTFENFSVNTRGNIDFMPDADSTKARSFLSPNAGQYYTLKLLGIEQQGAQQLAEIGFVSKSSQMAGSAVIDVVTGQLLRLKVAMKGFSFTSSNPDFELRNGVMNFECAFLPGDRVPILNYINTTYTADAKRKLKPTLAVHVSAFAFFYGGQPTPLPGVTYEKPNLNQADLAAVKMAPYDPVFWQNNSVVKRTPLEEEVIKSFEREKVFGNMLSPQ
ncbi:carboxypeptidase-like regulatory domain-containing protein [Hymenobacter lutimineralis]|uniref:Carboxypeptidase-like regulatory domain-containing protein n=1 Tax=Hymenobacter lutimineralis TaxID=2606448 RepID=A0A5D6VDH6_9BACT|nr:carboxypeptidase-like regulatory domain-containing protein [Hymenobacter lutimineralis]TYZ13430.1 carboxypeptidase-like regulatory domain-containing protein [Hymenobacter lutimineralis]